MADERRAILTVNRPDSEPERVEITADRSQVVGRLAAADITLKHQNVSRDHARFELTDKGLTLEDLGSSNGTYVGSDRLEANKKVLLKDGDVIRMGPFTVIFERIETAASAVAPTPPTPPPPAVPATPPIREIAEPTFDDIVPPAPPGVIEVGVNGKEPLPHIEGIPRESSNWMQYLPSVYADTDDKFIERFLIIFESIHAPLEWIVDNFDCYLDGKLTSSEWLRWFGSWVDIIVPESIPIERQRAVVLELGALFLTRGTRSSLLRHLELVFGITPEIEEPRDRPDTFLVKLPLGKENTPANKTLATRIVESQCPVNAKYELIIT